MGSWVDLGTGTLVAAELVDDAWVADNPDLQADLDVATAPGEHLPSNWTGSGADVDSRIFAAQIGSALVAVREVDGKLEPIKINAAGVVSASDTDVLDYVKDYVKTIRDGGDAATLRMTDAIETAIEELP